MDAIVQLLKNEDPSVKKLCVGCGTTDMGEGKGWHHVDIRYYGHNDVADVQESLPYDSGIFDLIYASHVLEHLPDLLPALQNLYRVAKPNATFIVAVPHGASDNAYEDPTHVRYFLENSFSYFSQCYYGGANYNYTADWMPKKVILILNPDLQEVNPDIVQSLVKTSRNTVDEMYCVLKAIKPSRTSFDKPDVVPVQFVFRDFSE